MLPREHGLRPRLRRSLSKPNASLFGLSKDACSPPRVCGSAGARERACATRLAPALTSGFDRSMREPCPGDILRWTSAAGLRRMPRAASDFTMRGRDKCPESASVDEPARSAKACFACNHDGLIAMLDRDLIEHPRDVVANGLLREPKRCGYLGIVQALGNAFEDCALARGELAKREV